MAKRDSSTPCSSHSMSHLTRHYTQLPTETLRPVKTLTCSHLIHLKLTAGSGFLTASPQTINLSTDHEKRTKVAAVHQKYHSTVAIHQLPTLRQQPGGQLPRSNASKAQKFDRTYRQEGQLQGQLTHSLIFCVISLTISYCFKPTCNPPLPNTLLT